MLDGLFVKAVNLAQRGQHLAVKHRRLRFGADIGGRDASDERFFLATRLNQATQASVVGSPRPRLTSSILAPLAAANLRTISRCGRSGHFFKVIAKHAFLRFERRVGRLE